MALPLSDGGTVTLGGNPRLTGPVGEFRAAIEDLLTQLFAYLRQLDVDTREVAENVATGRFAPWEADPIDVHDRLLE